MNEQQLIHELSVLLTKVTSSEDLVHRAEAYREQHCDQWYWSDSFSGSFQDWLERKREQIDYEWHRIDHLGHQIAAIRNPEWYERLDI